MDGHKRRAQLVGDVGCETALQLAVLLDRLRHLVEGLAQAGDLVLAVKISARREVAFLDGAGRLRHAVDGSHQIAREQKADARCEHDGHERREEHSLVGILAELLVRAAHKRIRPVDPDAYGADDLVVDHDLGERDLRGVLRFEGARGVRDAVDTVRGIENGDVVLVDDLDSDARRDLERGLDGHKCRRALDGERAVGLHALLDAAGGRLRKGLHVGRGVGLEMLFPHKRDDADGDKAGHRGDERERQGDARSVGKARPAELAAALLSRKLSLMGLAR